MAAAVVVRRAAGLIPLLSSRFGARMPLHRALSQIPPPRFCRLLSQQTKPFSASASNGAATDRTRELRLYNTKSRKKEQFRPRIPGREVGMYVCGVTPYDDSHIGHARAYVAFDVLYRYLRYLDYEVRYVRNFTDIDDKILDNRCAYVVGGDVYFSVDNFPEYGELSGRKLDDNRAGERVAVDERKRNPADFALWKAAKDGEPWWDSPWGPGRPGWHIECSAMSAHYLGHSFDIHGGGEDLIFPHHENEIAQSRAACCDSTINYWIHNGFVNVNSQKMSKSLGNFVTIRKDCHFPQVIEMYHPLALRMFLLGTHYRSPINYTIEQLNVASDRLYYTYQTLRDCEEICQHQQSNTGNPLPANTLNYIQKLHDEFETSMSDDLHTSVALAAMSEPLKVMNDLLHTRKGKKQDKRLESLSALEEKIRVVLSVLGLLPSSYHEALQQLRDKALRRASITEELVVQKIEERTAARKAKQYEKSDEIRKELAAVGIALMDGPDGTTWRPSLPLPEEEAVLAKT
ncbi:chloroplast protein synthesis1 [Zea mays]|uniref:cysteine--tRNA ligase n=1 Tax=Zea mays TaxID=4577 RepID=A0A1D6LAH0_MAIZE|nr:chloroplast protein synthesis1 [Zea mays]